MQVVEPDLENPAEGRISAQVCSSDTQRRYFGCSNYEIIANFPSMSCQGLAAPWVRVGWVGGWWVRECDTVQSGGSCVTLVGSTKRAN